MFARLEELQMTGALPLQASKKFPIVFQSLPIRSKQLSNRRVSSHQKRQWSQNQLNFESVLDVCRVFVQQTHGKDRKHPKNRDIKKKSKVIQEISRIFQHPTALSEHLKMSLVPYCTDALKFLRTSSAY